VVSGTSADLVLGLPQPLDLVIVVAPMAPVEARPDARFYVGMADRFGAASLGTELQRINSVWPDTDLIVLRPDTAVLQASSPNPLDPAAALPCFLATLRSMRDALAEPGVWAILERHFPGTRRHRSWLNRLRGARQ
jgi:hypothetical protein